MGKQGEHSPRSPAWGISLRVRVKQLDLHTAHQVTSAAALMEVWKKRRESIFLLENYTSSQPPGIQKGKKEDGGALLGRRPKGSARRSAGTDSASLCSVPASCLELGLRDPAGTTWMLPPPGWQSGLGHHSPSAASPARWQSTGQAWPGGHSLHQLKVPSPRQAQHLRTFRLLCRRKHGHAGPGPAQPSSGSLRQLGLQASCLGRWRSFFRESEPQGWDLSSQPLQADSL